MRPYEVGLLRNPAHDASDMATTLRQLGFEVTLLRDAARRPMVEAIDLFSRQLRQGGVGLFYFVGHGVQVSGENYLIPVDVRIGREQDVPYEAVPVGRILGGMEDADNQLNILILRISYETSYSAPDFHFMHAEWTDYWWGSRFSGAPDPGKRLPYIYRSIHTEVRGASHSPDYSPEQENRYTGGSLGFRCAKY